MSQEIEQRGSSRIKYPLKVSCFADYKIFETRAENLSLSGACLYLPESFCPGSYLGIIVKLPGMRGFVVIPSEVVWVKTSNYDLKEYRYQIGVRYLYLLPEVEEKIKALFRVLR